MRCLLFTALAAATSATSISALKAKIEGTAGLSSEGPFKIHSGDVIAKVSKEATEVTLTKEQQNSAWNTASGDSLIEAWRMTPTGLKVKQKDGVVDCTSLHGKDGKDAVAIKFTCGTSLIEGDGWPVKTGYNGDYEPEAFDDKDKQDMEFDPRVRFWHRCSDNTNQLSLCNKYNYIGADAMGYYGCEYTTVDGYCVKSYRHEWVEFNPNDLAFVHNPASPCPSKDPGCKPAGRFTPDPSMLKQ